MIDAFTEKLSNRLVLGLLLGGLLLLTYVVLQPFIIPVAWAVILAYATWPAVLLLRRALGGRNSLAALLMTLLLAAAFIVPVVLLALLMRKETATLYHHLDNVLTQAPFVLPAAIRDLPLLGEWLQETLDGFTADPAAMRVQLSGWLEEGAAGIFAVIGGVGRNAAKLGFALFTVFFLYRDGERLLAQVRRVLHRFLGARVDGYLSSVGDMTMAVVWGLIATALAQGFVAGLGYAWFGLKAPVLLGLITAVVAMIPFGTPFVWGTLGVWLLLEGEIFNGVGLLLWGTLAVSWVDNLVRPLVISSATRIPFILVMFGVLGGLAAFGLIGLFVGPVILAVLMAVWREWLDTAIPSTPMPVQAGAGPPSSPAPQQGDD